MIRRVLSSFSLALVCAAPLSATAAGSFAPQSHSCSGDWSLSDTSGLSLSCSGDLTLSGGSITADSALSIHAGGALMLQDITLSAQTITLFADVRIDIDGTSRFVTPTTVALGTGSGAPTPVLWPDGFGAVHSTITFTVPEVAGNVPEPGTWALMAAGLLAVGLVRRRA